MNTFAALIAPLALLSSCTTAPFNTHFSDLHPGMQRTEVTALLGRPVSAEAAGGSEVLFYRLASSFMDTDGSDTREYWVRLHGGTVEAYGERNDASAVERSRKQYGSAWGALGAFQRSQEMVTPKRVEVREDINVRGYMQHDVNGTLYLR